METGEYSICVIYNVCLLLLLFIVYLLPLSGVSCCSCRAFFRRTTLTINLRRLKKCKGGGGGGGGEGGGGGGGGRCRLNDPFNTCINCRYKKCLSIGMDPERVLVTPAAAATKTGKNRKTAGSCSDGTSESEPEIKRLYFYSLRKIISLGRIQSV